MKYIATSKTARSKACAFKILIDTNKFLSTEFAPIGREPFLSVIKLFYICQSDR